MEEQDMDVTQLLERDHRAVEQLFSQYEQDQDEDVLAQICGDLDVHMSLEEELVYPRLAELDPQMDEHARTEHAEAKDLVAQIRSGDRDMSTLVEQLQQTIQAHVQEEESETFPLMRERLAGDELARLGTEVERRKGQLVHR
jgi:hemerythrin superfamily protein